jgi:hypothetical protein
MLQEKYRYSAPFDGQPLSHAANINWHNECTMDESSMATATAICVHVMATSQGAWFDTIYDELLDILQQQLALHRVSRIWDDGG